MVLASLCFKYANRCQKLYMESKNNGVNTSPCGMEFIHFDISTCAPKEKCSILSSLKETF